MILETAITVGEIVFLYLMIAYGIKVCQNQLKYHAVTAALRISTAYASAGIPVGGVCILLRVVQSYVLEMKALLSAGKGEKKA